ncbi:MAG TPA: aminoglycoside phosphotransferase family protein [Intrasporangium sp.]|uniref:aminoglycoside phosphotransferase family protein n=1 Tax=Intrasporangium sp. TaxID=1925024 RepID=UPI002D786453|nr:aminoglycoside phosphotransferase family protein [Intrasporangium sp.]HET7398326.1 aminoglycoside phosphotransferase family protein [Intrasporangium sp.]
MHRDELDVGEGTVRRLVKEQFPRWSGLEVHEVPAAGTVNAIFRVGDGLAARFPRRAHDVGQARAGLRAEAAAAHELAGASTVPTPQPVAIGEPGVGYPMPWSVQTWLPGRVATEEDPAGSIEFALDLARLIAGLRAADTRGRRFAGGGRGGHLPDHDAWMETCFEHSEGLLDVPPLRAMWAQLRTLPQVDVEVMCHGDLTPPNVLVRAGRLVGVLDGGGFAAADPALDLVGAWHLLDDLQREAFREALGCTEIQWRRGMAWALHESMGLVWYYAQTNPTMSRWGRRTVRRLSAAWVCHAFGSELGPNLA